MLNISIGRLEIVDEDYQPYIDVVWGVEDKDAPFFDTPYAAVSGVTNRHMARIPQWEAFRKLTEIEGGPCGGVARLSVLIDQIRAIPSIDEGEYPLIGWLKYWSERAMRELGEDAYLDYSP